MVVRVGPPATASREPRQARKGATVAATPGAGVWLARAATLCPGEAPDGGVLHCGSCPNHRPSLFRIVIS